MIGFLWYLLASFITSEKNIILWRTSDVLIKMKKKKNCSVLLNWQACRIQFYLIDKRNFTWNFQLNNIDSIQFIFKLQWFGTRNLCPNFHNFKNEIRYSLTNRNNFFQLNIIFGFDKIKRSTNKWETIHGAIITANVCYLYDKPLLNQQYGLSSYDKQTVPITVWPIQ